MVSIYTVWDVVRTAASRGNQGYDAGDYSHETDGWSSRRVIPYLNSDRLLQAAVNVNRSDWSFQNQ